MAEVVLFHHAQGLTGGCRAFADALRIAGHTVHLPDLYDGRTFTEAADGMAFANEIGFGTLVERGRAATEELGEDLVYGGWSLGVLPAQALAQTRPGARGALLLHAAIPLEEFGGSWPDGVPLQVHVMERDALGDVRVARDLARQVDGSEVFFHPGDGHLFTDSSLPAYDEDATRLVLEHALRLLG